MKMINSGPVVNKKLYAFDELPFYWKKIMQWQPLCCSVTLIHVAILLFTWNKFLLEMSYKMLQYNNEYFEATILWQSR